MRFCACYRFLALWTMVQVLDPVLVFGQAASAAAVADASGPFRFVAGFANLSRQQTPVAASDTSWIALPAPDASTQLAETRSVALADLAADCDRRPYRGIIAFVSYDTWKGVVDQGWQNNGILAGVNYATRLGRLSDWTGIGLQIGASAAAWNWSGTDFRLKNNDEAQPQGFLTYGLFRKPTEAFPWSVAVVQDWMFNSNYGVFAENPTLSQWRGQVGYALSAANEIGLWGTWRARGDTRQVAGFGAVSWRAVNQLSVYARHKWAPGGADTAIWVGVPENDRLSGEASLGDYLIGLSADVPISNRVLLYTLITYLHPSAATGPAGYEEEAWNFTIGLAFYPGYNARASTVAGRCWLPLLPVANNGWFLVDTNRVY